jgi:hypothetical protein
MRIQLSDDDLEQLMRPVRGQGGWQSLVRRLQRQVDGNVIEIGKHDQQSILHYLLSYGTGGWQGRIAGIAGMSRTISKPAKRKTRRRGDVVAG